MARPKNETFEQEDFDRMKWCLDQANRLYRSTSVWMSPNDRGFHIRRLMEANASLHKLQAVMQKPPAREPARQAIAPPAGVRAGGAKRPGRARATKSPFKTKAYKVRVGTDFYKALKKLGSDDIARDAGVQLRATWVDGVPQICTRDYLPERINVKVVNGIITEVEANG